MDSSTREPLASQLAIAALSIGVCVAVPVALYALPKAPGAPTATLLPTLSAALNAGAAVCLLTGFLFIKRGARGAHRFCMTTALVLSSLFLVSYLLHHAQAGSVPFQGRGAWRAVYFALLLPHIVLAVPTVPLALLTWYRGATGRLAAHRRLGRIALPIWGFVSASGVLVYVLLYWVGRAS